jgi:hypothetical protein
MTCGHATTCGRKVSLHGKLSFDCDIIRSCCSSRYTLEGVLTLTFLRLATLAAALAADSLTEQQLDVTNLHHRQLELRSNQSTPSY